MEMKIDYSRIPETQVEQKSSYRPPRHVYFGKRDPETGMMEEEPQYKHQDYPRMMYKLIDGVIVADIIHDDTSLTLRIGAGWVKNPAELGYLTAPSFDQVLAMKNGGKITPEKLAKEADAALAGGEPVTAPGEKKWRDMNAQERADFQAKKQAQYASAPSV